MREALLDTDAILLRWFNHWLKDSANLRASRGFAISYWAKIAGARRKHFRAGENPYFICAARGEPIRARAMAELSATPPAADEPCDIFVYDPEVPVLAPGGDRGRAANSTRRRSNWATICWSIRRSRWSTPLRFWHAARRVVLRDFVAPYRFHREAGARAAEWRGGIYLHGHRAFELAFRGRGIRGRQGSSMGV